MNTERQRALRSLTADAHSQPRDGLTGDIAIERMADDMRIAYARNGSVTKDDMSLIGWRRTQLDRYGEDARVMAQHMAGAI